MRKIIVAGGRDFDDRSRLGRILKSHFVDAVMLNGACPSGADQLAHEWAEWTRPRVEVRFHHADWHIHGRAAGPIRNQEMAKEGDVLIAFWDGKSRGTKHMIQIALDFGLEVHVYRYTK